jgi:hypothetical protein
LGDYPGVFRAAAVSANNQINGELIAAAKNSAVVVRIGNFVKDEDKRVTALPEAGNEIFKTYVRAGRFVFNLQGDSPVAGRETVQIKRTCPFKTDFPVDS